jgi:hypothetical protein
MSHARTILHGHEPHAGTLQARSVSGILLAATAVAVIAGLVTTAVLNKSPAASEMHGVAIVRAAPVDSVASPGTGVPEASKVFAGKDMPADEPASTF